ncbi:unnamed protein product [Thelazia callipaeda]|uniref:Polyglutamine-binding protein 1 n=1 Tax=Thelazia callipaeda TaxID=103827 RepID=A0A0N5D303_THECL|nr:unnamed protein product [Thelazia callipaeda]
MPLPPALLARLKRRGIVDEDVTEEVIAENYDVELPLGAQSDARQSSETNVAGAKGCPNKWNPYHYCVQFCYDYWRDGTSENKLSQKYLEQRNKVLKKYPLPNGWKEVYDPGCARYYYWCPRTDEVSWLPPRHPLAVIGDAAPKVAREMFDKGENTNGISECKITYDERANNENEVSSKNFGGRRHAKKRRHSLDSDGSESFSASDSGEENTIELNDRDKLKRAKRKGIDPMDPAAYGDHVPVGTWNSGLHAHDKTGADVTASGPLFQQRPYPAPGVVLRKQQKKR